MSSCPKWSSLSILGSCSRVRVQGNMRWARESEQRERFCIYFATPWWWRELSQKAKLSIYRSIFVPTLTYGHEGWVMTERTRSRIQSVEMGFFRRVASVSLRDRVRSSVIREWLGVEPLLLCIERSQLRWFGHLVRMPPGRFPWEVFQAHPAGRRPRGRPRTSWRDYISTLAWEHLGIPQSELANVAGRREVWETLLELLPPRPDLG